MVQAPWHDKLKARSTRAKRKGVAEKQDNHQLYVFTVKQSKTAYDSAHHPDLLQYQSTKGMESESAQSIQRRRWAVSYFSHYANINKS